jgi:hypothetical protein
MILAQQLVAAILNYEAFGTPVPNNLITAGNNAFAGTDKAEMLRVASLLGAYNERGDNLPLPPGMTPGPAKPIQARTTAYPCRIFWDF